ncbi:AAWKG family protein, partial [Streptomyces sp. NPDC000880]
MPNTADADDYWGQAVNLLTGFPMPVRKTLFDSLKSADGIPLFRIQLDRFAVRPVSSGDMGWHVSPGEDFDVVFYGSEDGDGAHPIREMNRIRIVFIGVANDANGKGRLADPGETGLGGKFSSSVEDVDWDVGPLSNYVGGPRAALNALLSPGNGYSTRDVEYNGTTVADADAVDLMSFRHTADSFDRTAQFFVQQAKVLQQWETSLGEEQAAWKGQAAGLFWNLIHEVRKNYDSYVEQVGGEGYQGPTAMIDGHRATSTPGEALAVAQQQLQIRATNLRDAWDRWADGWHDPHRYVLQILEQDIAPWIAANNWPYIQKHTASTGYGASTTYSSTPEFKMDHPTWGQLWNTDTWRKIGEEAVKRWNDRVEAILGTAGAMVLADLKNNWIDASSSFEDALRTVSQDTLSDIYQQEEAEIAQEQADQQAQDLNSSLNDLGGGLGDIGDSLSGLNDGLGDLGNGINDGLNGFSSSLNGPG